MCSLSTGWLKSSVTRFSLNNLTTRCYFQLKFYTVVVYTICYLRKFLGSSRLTPAFCKNWKLTWGQRPPVRLSGFLCKALLLRNFNGFQRNLAKLKSGLVGLECGTGGFWGLLVRRLCATIFARVVLDANLPKNAKFSLVTCPTWWLRP